MRTDIGAFFHSERDLTQIERSQELAQEYTRFGIKIWEDMISRFGNSPPQIIESSNLESAVECSETKVKFLKNLIECVLRGRFTCSQDARERPSLTARLVLLKSPTKKRPAPPVQSVLKTATKLS